MEKVAKKIALLTICPLNLGAILQAFALKEYVSISYSNVSVDLLRMKKNVDYNAKIIKKHTGSFIIDAIINIISVIKYPRLKLGIRRKERFKEKHFTFIDRESLKSFIVDVPYYDIYLTGSDQVFRTDLDKTHSDVFYQKFKSKGAKKIAYASSFGIGEFSQSFIDSIKPDILDFDFLSCREQSGADLMTTITGREIQKVVDPTLLLDAHFWNKVAVQPKIKYKYIFIYDLNGGEGLIEIAQKIKAETGFKIVCLTQKPQKFYRGIDKQIYGAGPAEFLGWIAQAQYVVTDSFHGTIFAINYNRPFTSYIAFKKVAQRIVSLLEELLLTDRITENPELFSFSAELLTLEYDKNKLKTMIDISKNYLDLCLKNE